MDQLAVVDPFVLLGFGLMGLLGTCIAIMVLMRDTGWVPPHIVSESVLCPATGRRVVVDFIERVDTGLRQRSVERCPLRGPGERCSEDCCVVHSVPPSSRCATPA